jgi:hypothetical protein
MTKYTINELANSKGITPLVREALLQMADYKQLYEQVCEQYDVLAKELEAIKQALAAPVQEPHKGLSEHLAQATNGRVRIDPVTGNAGIGTPPAQPAPVKEPVLQDIEQYRLQMAGISTAAIGYWKESDGIYPDYDTPALRDVAKLYAKYDALYTAAQPATEESSATQPAQRQWVVLTDEEKRNICRVGPVYAPDGVVTRRPLEYRKELEGVALTAVRKAEAKLKEKNSV